MPMTAHLTKFALSRMAGATAFGLTVFTVSTVPAQAYVGPGLGLGAVSTALGVVGAIVLGIIAFIWYPIKRLIRRIRARFAAPPATPSASLPVPRLRTDQVAPIADEIAS